jgi:hypothetical protein
MPAHDRSGKLAARVAPVHDGTRSRDGRSAMPSRYSMGAIILHWAIAIAVIVA